MKNAFRKGEATESWRICDAGLMKTYILMLLMAVTVSVMVSGCASEPATTTTTTTHSESTKSGGSY
ncbi:MAG: hypothetical protein ACR2HH_05310 [Chthoniobacterales bacterium]